MNWGNPYPACKGEWLRGNLHTHSGEGLEPEEIFAAYERLGYDFVSLTDHRKVNLARPPRSSRLLTLPGMEWNSPWGDHMGLISFDVAMLKSCAAARDPDVVLNRVASRSVLTILNHPNWQEPPHYSREVLGARIGRAHGIEIYNGLIDVLAGTALATEKWDYLLSRGMPAWGFATDDAHTAPHVGQAWVMAHVSERSARALFRALCRGSFYCSTGVRFRCVRRCGTRVEAIAENGEEIWAIGDWGRRLRQVRGDRIVFDFRESATSYIRFTAFGPGAQMGWTQPFYRSAGEGSSRRTSPS